MNLARRAFLAGGCAFCALGTVACTPVDNSGQRPTTGIDGRTDLSARNLPGMRTGATDDDDDGLRGSVDKIERQIKTSRSLVRDPAVNAYLKDLVGRLAGDYAPDIRPYLLRVPDFNAGQYPNGMMQIWSGLLLRCTDEAQLAAVLGHEIGHYLRAHSREQLRSRRQMVDASQILAMIFGAAGAPQAADLTSLMLTAAFFSYGRDQEREADEIGIRRLAEIGLDPLAASGNWDNILAEIKALGIDPSSSVVFATHPDSAERASTLRARARELPAGARHAQEYARAIAAIRPFLFDDQIRKGQHAATILIAGRWLEANPNDGLARYAKGESYRLRAKDGDEEAAIEALAAALEADGTPPTAWRSLGSIRRKRGETAEANTLFREYLRRQPNAPDRDLIRRSITS